MTNPYIPSTASERRDLLEAIEVHSLEDLLKQIPQEVRWTGPVPDGHPAAELLVRPLTEMELTALARQRAEQNADLADRPSFLGAGTYRHFIPSAVGHLALRSEFLTAYTPYQPEASQGLLQAIFEFQTYISRLTGMDVANAGLYDGATALAEAALMGLSARPAAKRVVLSRAIHPQYREVVRTHVSALGAEVIEVDCADGATSLEKWREALGLSAPKDAAGGGASPSSSDASPAAAVALFQSPNFFGCLEDGAALVEAAHKAGALAAVAFNPIALGVLATPGQWGADIAVAEGQPLGMAPGAGGETLGLFAARAEHVWKMPGRLVGLTRDREGRRAYVLTLQSREQHIRRARATSNICTNHSLFALMACIYMATVSAEGLRELAGICAGRCALARRRLAQIPGCQLAFPKADHFHEFALRTGRDARELERRIARESGILAGYPLGREYPELADALLVCTTEMTSEADIERLAVALEQALGARRPSDRKKK